MKEHGIIKIEDTTQVEDLFQHTTDTVILSCLQKVMGEVYATEDLQSAVAILGNFSFFVGIPRGELLSFSMRLCFCHADLNSADPVQNHGKHGMDYLVMVPEMKPGKSRLRKVLARRQRKESAMLLRKKGYRSLIGITCRKR